MKKTEKYTIGIVGGGIAGLSAGLALLQAGHRVSIFEKSMTLKEVGAGIQLSRNATQVLQSWGVLSGLQPMAFIPKGIRMAHWKTGKAIALFSQNTEGAGLPYLHIHRADLHSYLCQAVQALDKDAIHTGHTVEKVETTNRQATIHFVDHTEQVYDWVIGADGIHSIVRPTALAEEGTSDFTGNVAWRGLIDVEHLPVKPKPYTHVMMGPGGHIVMYYVKGGRKLNYVAVVERDNWETESWTEKGNVDDLLRDFAGWDAGVLSILSKTPDEECYRWALHDRAPLSRWNQGRCIVIGDAAHPMLPFLAQGAAMGIEDAQALAWCFEQYSADSVGQEFSALRHDRAAKVQRAARKNMTIFHERSKSIRWVRDSMLSMLSAVYPNFMNRKLQWLYEYKL